MGEIRVYLLGLFMIFCFSELKCNEWFISNKKGIFKLDSVVLYSLNSKERIKEIYLTRKDTLADSLNIIVFYYKKRKYCILQKLSEFKCDTNIITVLKEYNCNNKINVPSINVKYCDNSGKNDLAFSIEFPCCNPKLKKRKYKSLSKF